MTPNYELLGKWIDLVNTHGRDSAESKSYLEDHKENAEFTRLAAATDELRDLFEAKS